MKNLLQKAWIIYSELVRAGFSEDQSLALLLREAEEKNEKKRLSMEEVRDVTRKIWTVYNWLVKAGFSEDEALAMLLTKEKGEKLERIQ